MRKSIAAIIAFTLLAGSAPLLAAPCRDAKGKFAKCSPAAKHCRAANGKFAKCGLPGTHPA